MFHDDELEESEKFYVDQPRFLLLFYAMYNTLVARSEMVCYFVIILNHMISASIITLLLPILIFLWAMLSVPRPSRRFWMMAIVYTEVGRSVAWRLLRLVIVISSSDLVLAISYTCSGLTPYTREVPVSFPIKTHKETAEVGCSN